MKNSQKSLVFRARDAARRFARRPAVPAEKTAAWSPVGLSWRRRQKGLIRPTASGNVGNAVSISFPRFHFQFGLSTNICVTRAICRMLAAQHTAKLRRDLFTGRNSPVFVPGTEAGGVAMKYQGFVKVQSADGPTRKSFNPARSISDAATSRGSLRPFEYVTRRLSPTSRLEADPKTNFRRHSLMEPVRQPPSFRKQRLLDSPIRPRAKVVNQTAMPSARSTKLTMHESVHREAHNVLRHQSTRTEELIWRRLVQTMSGTSRNDRQGYSAAETIEPPEFTKHSAAALSHTAESMTAQAITRLDPAIVDRLSDEVIRKVEQRVRIERERRGI